MTNRGQILQINDNTLTLFTKLNILQTNPDIIIETDDDELHKKLMEKSMLRFGDVDRNVFTYLIGGKIIQVNGTKKVE
jgi:hypothetical protein